MEHKLATAERRVLVQLVKTVQQKGLEGENGGWKEFLNSHDKKIGSSLSDPSRRANDVLIAFLTTFKQKEHLQMFARVLQLDSNRDLIEKFKEESPDKETPEQRLVRLTISHHEYPTDYSFPSFAEDWFVSETGKKKSKMMKSTRMVAIDCEMVGCEDGSDAVVRVAAVDRDLNVILDKFVKPDKPVVDYRTHITGVTAEDLERATLSVADIQKKLRRFLSKGTILVGHSLNNDLKVLKIDHARVIDTSMVFKFANATNFKRPSLNYLCKVVLGHEVRNEDVAHNCVHDAAGAMKLVLAVVEKGVDLSVPLSEELVEAEKKKLEADKNKLLIHKIPLYVRSQELEEVLSGNFTVDVKPPKTGGGFYSAVFVFDNPEEANQAFENVDGNLAKDKSGLSQKMLNFNPRSGAEATIYVRKMVHDGEISATTRARTDVNNDSEETRETNPNHGIEEMLESEKTRLENEETKLLLHKIPHSVSSQEIKGVVTGDFTLDIMPPKRGYYSAVAIFNSPEEANEAFENVDGDLATDRMGLPQKLAVFKLSSGLGATLFVRKMVKDDGNTATKRAHTEENNVSSKRQKRENVAEETKETNVNHGIEKMSESEKTSLENEETKLLLHKIPHSVSSQEIKGVVTGDFTLDIMPPKRGHYSAIAIFNSPEEANQAFENVEGELAKDRMGLPQKLAAFKLSSGSGATLYVRKMVQDGGNSATKRAHTEENSPSSKRQKREDDSEETKVANGNHPSVESLNEYHLKKIEKLKQKEAKDSVKSTKGHLMETEELKTKLRAKDSVESSEDHLKEIEQLKQKVIAQETEIQAHKQKVKAQESEIQAHKQKVKAQETEIQAHKQKVKAQETEIQAQDKIIANLKQKLERKSR